MFASRHSINLLRKVPAVAGIFLYPHHRDYHHGYSLSLPASHFPHHISHHIVLHVKFFGYVLISILGHDFLPIFLLPNTNWISVIKGARVRALA